MFLKYVIRVEDSIRVTGKYDLCVFSFLIPVSVDCDPQAPRHQKVMHVMAESSSR
jgi:hypothetical protein